MPLVFRIVAVSAILTAIGVVGIGFYKERSRAAFKLKSEHTQLSRDVVSEIQGYERLETSDGVAQYYIKADHAKTFSDNHLELDNVYLEIYGDQRQVNDKMTALRAIYIPEEEKNFTAYLKGNVQIETADALKVRTEAISYSRKTEVAETSEPIEFERDNVRGNSLGATVKMGEKVLDLLGNVQIETFESKELLASGISYSKIQAGSANFDQIANKISLNSSVSVTINGKDRSSDIKSNRAVIDFTGNDSRSAELKQLELFENVLIVSTQPDSTSNTIETAYALYEKAEDRYSLKSGAHIYSNADGRVTDIRANEAVFDQSAGKILLTGSAEVTQGGNLLKGNSLSADLYPNQKIRQAIVRGDASAKQTSTDRTFVVTAPELNAEFGVAGELKEAKATGRSLVEMVPNKTLEYASVLTRAERGIGLVFKGEGMLESLITDGRTTINLNDNASGENAANKRVTADSVKTFFNSNGKDIRKAEAVGNAELFVEPLTANTKSYRTTILAPRFDCVFFPTGNKAQTCIAATKAKAVRVPTVSSPGKGTQTISADVFTAKFGSNSGDISEIETAGNSKYIELDRNGVAKQLTFTQNDEIIRLRGGTPTIWDSRGRAKAEEIDIDLRNDRSFLRKAVSTTYYSQKQINGSTPFGSSDKPVYLTAQNAEFYHAGERAIYNGNARVWQENNFVRGEKIVIDQRNGSFMAEGNVQSMIHNAKLKKQGADSSAPTSASAASMSFDKSNRVLRYRSSVDIRTGTDRITADIVDLYLSENNELIRTIAESNVTISQPARKATGSWAEYSSETETAVLRGEPAIVSDPENGSSQGGQLTFSMKENKVTADGKTKQNTTGRIRTVYKIKDQRP